MPELPEVETVRRGLDSLIRGRQINSVEFDHAKSFPNAQADVNRFMVGARAVAVRRRAKVLMIDLDSEYTLVVHLKMTGQLVFVNENLEDGSSKMEGGRSLSSGDQIPIAKASKTLFRGRGDDAAEFTSLSSGGVSPSLRFGAGHPNDSLVGDLPDRSTRVVIQFSDGSHLYFNDQRKFGWMRLMPSLEVPNIDFMKRVGPEPLEADFSPDDFAGRFLRRPRTSIKAALLDQTVVAGVGNIYADEALWGAMIHPARLVNSLSQAELYRLYDQVRAVMNLSIEKGGSTDKNYVNAEGGRGSYLNFANVFRREGQPCNRCGHTIIKTRVAGRGTHICPVCQVA